MGEEKGTMDWKERRRALAHELRAEGWQQTEIARILGVTQGAVSQWMRRPVASQANLTGRKPRLAAFQKAELARHLAAHPSLSRTEIARFIKERYGVRYSLSHISRLRQELTGR